VRLRRGEESPGSITVKLVSQTNAWTERASLQTRPPPTYYLHAKSVANGSFEDLGLVVCEWKGQSTYYDAATETGTSATDFRDSATWQLRRTGSLSASVADVVYSETT
jgi:uncharacterized protein (DUF427 family)